MSKVTDYVKARYKPFFLGAALGGATVKWNLLTLALSAF